jgi:hypothetical protein
MKKMGELMQEMGFRKDAPDSVKEAFLKHLIKNATGVEVVTPSEKAAQLDTKSLSTKSEVTAARKKVSEPIQLEFGFFHDESRKKAKVS